jgi:hypothetical protein
MIKAHHLHGWYTIEKSSLPPGYRVTGQEGQQQVTYSGLICDLAKPFTLTANTNWWEMTFQLTPASPPAGSSQAGNPQAGTFTVTGIHNDVGPYAGEERKDLSG